MQASFWKTVAAVAVIGMGSLAILEVQNRLPKPGSTTAVDPSLAEQVASTGDEAIDAILSEGEFDRLMQEGSSQPAAATTFHELSEPAEPSASVQTAAAELRAGLTAATGTSAQLKPTPTPTPQTAAAPQPDSEFFNYLKSDQRQ